MKMVRVYRNEDVRRIIAFIPKGHRHVRILLEFVDGAVVIQEATAAAIVRAYMNVVTHPFKRAVELVSQRVSGQKEGYADYQLLETGRSEEEIFSQLESILEPNKS